MLDALARILPFLLIAVLVVNLLQRGLTKPDQPDQPARAAAHPRSGAAPRPRAAQRAATLILAGLVLAAWAAVLLLQRFRAPDWTAPALAAAAGGAAFGLRARLKAFPLRCRQCGRRLPPGITLGIDAAAAARYEAGACPAPDCAAAGGGPAPRGAAKPDAAAHNRSAARDQ